jgi:mannose-6-phosphate isomerase-like protein (cupin superfamily)
MLSRVGSNPADEAAGAVGLVLEGGDAAGAVEDGAGLAVGPVVLTTLGLQPATTGTTSATSSAAARGLEVRRRPIMPVRVVEPLRLGRNRSLEDDGEMDAFELTALEAERAASGRAYLEFLRVPALSVGLYTLEAGAVDGQSPHTEDEVYVVMAGRARIAVGGEVREVGPGSVVYVAATVPHLFHDITERLEILVVFAPAEYSQAGS